MASRDLRWVLRPETLLIKSYETGGFFDWITLSFVSPFPCTNIVQGW